MRRKPKEEFVAKAVTLPDNEPAVLDVGNVYIHPVMGPVRCEKFLNLHRGLNPVPCTLLTELYPQPGRVAQQVTMPQIEVKGSHIRYPAEADEIKQAFGRLGRVPDPLAARQLRGEFGAMLLSNDLNKLADLVCMTLGRQHSDAGKLSPTEEMMGSRAASLLARECALVMKYELSVGEAMVRDALRAGGQKRGQHYAPGSHIG